MSPGAMQDITLDTVAKGSAPERFQDELAKVIANILDPNTDPEAVRAITLTVKIKPGESREHAVVELAAKSKLAPPRPVPDMMYFGRSKEDGELVATRYDPQQLEIGEDPDTVDVLPIHDRKQEAK